MTDQHGGYGMPTPADRLNSMRQPVPPAPVSNASSPRKIRMEFVVLGGALLIAVLGAAFVLRGESPTIVSSEGVPVIAPEAEVRQSVSLLSGEAFIGVALEIGNFPIQLKKGDVVRVITTPSVSGGGDAKELPAPMTVKSVETASDVGGRFVVTLQGPRTAATEIAMSGPVHLTIVEEAAQ